MTPRVESPESPAEVEALRRRLLKRDEDLAHEDEDAVCQSGAGLTSTRSLSWLCFGGVLTLGAFLMARQWMVHQGLPPWKRG